ncbi:MAG TPA: alkaline phosphatase family protein [Polyangiaceae bacterium]|nr:alkaline phosphatase family protein [Polyangiaceae bacterium]
MTLRFAFARSSFVALHTVALAALLTSTGCSSKDSEGKNTHPEKDGGGGGGQPGDSGPTVDNRCHPTASLAAKRNTCDFGPGAAPEDTIGDCPGDAIPIEHVVLIMQENRSFDQYFGHFKGHGQDDVDVPAAPPTNPAGAVGDAGASGTVTWHHEDKWCQPDTDHGWVASHQQWNGGQMDGFATSNAVVADPTGGRALGYYEEADLPFYYQLYSTFATSDRYFCSLLGPTYPNRLFFLAGTSFGATRTDLSAVAPKGAPFILRQLDEKGVTWKVYKTNLPSVLLFADYATDSKLADHFVQAEQFAVDAAAGTLPQVSIVDANYSDKAWLETDEHPPADAQLGQHWVWQQVQALVKGPQWNDAALFITYDEHGGLYDHVEPPPACAPDDIAPKERPDLGGFDRLGFRVPVVVVSPYAKRHFVSHEVHSHTSILRFVQTKFGLSALTNRDANSDAMLDFFDFDHAPNLDVPDFAEPAVDQAALDDCKAAFP